MPPLQPVDHFRILLHRLLSPAGLRIYQTTSPFSPGVVFSNTLGVREQDMLSDRLHLTARGEAEHRSAVLR
jgi:hypothetical protein